MKKIFLLAILSLVMAYSAFAEDCAITAKSTNDLLSQIPSLNSKLSTCNSTIPSPINILFKTETINLQIFMQDGSKKSVLIEIVNSKLTKIEEGSSNNPTYVIGIGECELDTLLRSDNQIGVAKYLYNKKKLIISPVGFWKKIKFGIAIIGVKIAIKAPSEVEVACSTATGEAATKKKVGEVCNHGGECLTGNCVGVGQGPPWTYKCSCDAFKYVAADTDGKCPGPGPVPTTKGKKAGELCNHGGECVSGNCVGVGQGPPWVYKCSCDAFRYVPGDADGNCR